VSNKAGVRSFMHNAAQSEQNYLGLMCPGQRITQDRSRANEGRQKGIAHRFSPSMIVAHWRMPAAMLKAATVGMESPLKRQPADDSYRVLRTVGICLV
jgi:hypothetical protein